MATASKKQEDGECVYLTLGDGDFSYSVDLARYLSSQAPQTGNVQTNKLIASGVDSHEELKDKYRDSASLLRELNDLGAKNESLSVDIHHGVNAVTTLARTPDEPKARYYAQAHHVIFNHPHLGREDAARHARFLAHFLYSASNYWMKTNGGVLHLTLVKAQYERWDCEASAERHGLVLLERNPFRPPPVANPRYRHRRHQTGKSFASRATGGSETFTFGRKEDSGKHVARHLPWQHAEPPPSLHPSPESTFSCDHCERVFREERSLKNHIRSVHGSGDRKRKRTEVLVCDVCRKDGVDRTFPHEQSLADHIRAKHSGGHSSILPDWASKHQNEDAKEETTEKEGTTAETHASDGPPSSSKAFGQCPICQLVYAREEDASNHLADFLPSPAFRSPPISSDGPAAPFPCSYCDKEFRDKRAQLQHENFCSTKPQYA